MGIIADLIPEEDRHKPWNDFKNKLPSSVRVGVVIFLIIVLGGGYFFRGELIGLIKQRQSETEDGTTAPTVSQGEEDKVGRGGEEPIVRTDEGGSVGGSFTTITDFSTWENYEKFDSESEGSQKLFPAFSSFFPEGRTMYSPFLVDPRFKMIVEFKPLSSNRGNVIFSIENFFQCVIGNGNYKHIDCDVPPYDTEYLIEERQQQQHAWINRPAGVKSETTQFMTVEMSPVLDSELIDVKLDLKFVPADSEDGQYKVEEFRYKIPTGRVANSIRSRIGLGIIDPEKYRPYQPDEAGFELFSIKLEE